MPAHPALWSVTDSQGHKAWLFGTIHSAPAPLAWHSPVIDKALDQAGTIVVEVGNLRDDAAVSATFARLAATQNAPPLSQRVPAQDRPALEALLTKSGLKDTQFAQVDTWAAALTLARSADPQSDADYGVDRAILALANKRPVKELEGAQKQLGIFDALPERDQRALLTGVIHEASGKQDTDLAARWREGDIKAIARQTHTGLLADPHLREALYTARNRDWLAQIEQAIRANERPFVAVGAAHMAGEDGLVALLKRNGYTVKRLQ